MKNYVTHILLTATAQVSESKLSSKIGWFYYDLFNFNFVFNYNFSLDDKSSDTAFAIYYGKFQASAPKAKRITSVIEERLDRSNEYEQLLIELHQTYLSQRAEVYL